MDRDGGSTNVLVVLDPDPAADGEEVDVLVHQLRTAILALDVDTVTRAPDTAVPDGAKGDGAAIGALIVALSASGGVFPSLLDLLREWLARRGAGHRISVTVGGDSIDVANVSPDEQKQLIEVFLRAHRPG